MSSKIDLTGLKLKDKPLAARKSPTRKSPTRSKKKSSPRSSDDEGDDWLDLSQGGGPDKDNYNAKCTEILDQLLKQMVEENRVESDKKIKRQNQFRIKAVREGIQILKDHDKEIMSGYEAKQLKGIGQGLADRIDEIIETGTLRELANKVTEESLAVTSLTTVKGVGDKHALTFYHQYGIKTAEQLKQMWKKGEDVDMGLNLTHEMQVALKFYDDLLLKVPYDEIELVRPIIEPILSELDSDLRYEICGSHRRGSKYSGDIDVLITHTKIKSMDDLKKGNLNFLGEIVDALKEVGFLIDEMLLKPGQLFRGICKVKTHARQIDFHMVSWESYPTALLHFTGSKNFNVQMRRVALRKGYTLTEFGLYKLENGKKGAAVPIKSERDVFKTLKVKYLEPEKREFGK